MRKKRKPIPATISVVTLLWCVVASAGAEDVSQSDLELCAGMETAELKLACFEALAAIGRRIDAPLPEESDGSETDRGAPPPRTNSEVADSVPVSELSGREANVAVTTTEPAVPPDAAASAKSAAGSSDEIGQLGLEHLDRSDDRAEALTLSVVEVSEGRFGALNFHMENGQVWRQIEARRFRYPKRAPFDVIISQGVMGDYRLRTDEKSPMTRIRRVK